MGNLLCKRWSKMKIYQLQRKQLLPITIEEAWDFFSKAENLQSITPDYMNFLITNSPGTEIYNGQLITYKVSPILSVPLTWVTEITHVKTHQYFIDEQRFGPFKFWHHQHHFKETDAGIHMEDQLHYALPFSFIGRTVHSLVVRNRIESIFDYRYKHLEERFQS